MKSLCPNCGAPFMLPTGYDLMIKCPTCSKEFLPIDIRHVEAEQHQTLAQKIKSYFANISDPLASEICCFLEENAPVLGRGGYEGYESEIEQLIEKALSTTDFELTNAMLKSLADAHDWYFCHKLLSQRWPSAEAENHVARAVVSAPHLGGQSADYFHLLAMLIKKRNDVLDWCRKIGHESKPGSILAENMELVLSGRYDCR